MIKFLETVTNYNDSWNLTFYFVAIIALLIGLAWTYFQVFLKPSKKKKELNENIIYHHSEDLIENMDKFPIKKKKNNVDMFHNPDNTIKNDIDNSIQNDLPNIIFENNNVETNITYNDNLVKKEETNQNINSSNKINKVNKTSKTNKNNKNNKNKYYNQYKKNANTKYKNNNFNKNRNKNTKNSKKNSSN